MRKSLLSFLFLLALLSQATAEPPAGPDDQRIDYGSTIAPLLSRHCLQCHGPDADQRQAGLRLDSRRSAIDKLNSGSTAIVPGQPLESELLKRVKSTGSDRMPPEDHGAPLSKDEIDKLAAWIQQGAVWESHWSFTPPTPVSPPEVQGKAWVQNPIDQFILSKLEQNSVRPFKKAGRRKLIRRLYVDLTGLPPTAAQVQSFLDDRSPDAWKRLVDRVLSSPQYGQRWGRHWLDVARYGDSNGGDENHSYPFAWRYRDYVISSLNADLPFDEFVHEQLAGDLLAAIRPTDGDGNTAGPEPLALDNESRLSNTQLTATGFLALGTKILAEQDEVKKQADIVDEQIDTIGKTFLALTFGCARCHDHKFDPIPTNDYYALAGIFHSTQLVDRPIPDAATEKALAEHQSELQQLTKNRNQLQKEFDQQLAETASHVLVLEAEDFMNGNVASLNDGYGEGIGIISDRGSQKNFAEYDVSVPAHGKYLIQLRYAAKDARPGRILIDGEVVSQDAITETTGGWMPEHQRWLSEGVFQLNQGRIKLRLESEPLMSHIDKIRLIHTDQMEQVTESLSRIESLDTRLNQHRKQVPQPDMVMAVREGTPQNTRVHIRGSHMQLGEEVSRGFPCVISSTIDQSDQPSLENHPIPDDQSGRLQLAFWMTDTGTGAGGQTARVICNRIWHWHFGKGLVGTPDDFGMRGSRPTHPGLLNWLALELVKHNWSLKYLHRLIVTSATYQQETQLTPNHWIHGFPRHRIEAEAIRDSMLFHSGALSLDLVGEPPAVKSQDPSPTDLKSNENIYRTFRRRSVYLPVVRCNTQRFLTLFDFPNAATPVGRRDITTVPTQALLLMNANFVMQQAERIARRILVQQQTKTGNVTGRTETVDPNRDRIASLYNMLFQRPATVQEMETLQSFLETFGKTVKEGQEGELSTWTTLVHTLLLSSEYIHVD